MTAGDCGYLLLSSKFGDPDRRPLTTAQLRILAQRAAYLPQPGGSEALTLEHLLAAGVEKQLAEKTLVLLDDTLQLNAYLSRARRTGCTPITRANPGYPVALRKRLGLEAPGCLWAKGNLDILSMPSVSLVGSRALKERNRRFAREVGIQAAKQGFALISGNARGADSAAQDACLEAGGYVVSVLADSLNEYCPDAHRLYLSEDDYDECFSVLRALHRNRVIHALSDGVFVAQCTLERGGTWDGSVQNLRKSWSNLYCLRDGSPAADALAQMGAFLIDEKMLADFRALPTRQPSLFHMR